MCARRRQAPRWPRARRGRIDDSVEAMAGRVCLRRAPIRTNGTCVSRARTYRIHITAHSHTSQPSTRPCKGQAAPYLNDAPMDYCFRRAGAVMSDIWVGPDRTHCTRPTRRISAPRRRLLGDPTWRPNGQPTELLTEPTNYSAATTRASSTSHGHRPETWWLSESSADGRGATRPPFVHAQQMRCVWEPLGCRTPSSLKWPCAWQRGIVQRLARKREMRNID